MTAGAKEWGGEGKCLGFAELAEYRINSVKRRVYLFLDLGRKIKNQESSAEGFKPVPLNLTIDHRRRTRKQK